MKPPPYVELDAVADTQGNTGTVYQCLNGRTRETFLQVKIQSGPRKGQWDKPWKFGRPLIDWSRDGQFAYCCHCERQFRQLTDEDPKTLCRTCSTVAAKNSNRQQQPGLTTSELRDLRERPWRFNEGR